jgi:hypothetical protein
MADNTTLNAGTGGDVIATDDLTTLNGGAVSGVKAQRVKVGFGSDASLRDVDASNGLPVLPLATEAHLGQVGGTTVILTASFNRPANTTAYALADIVADNVTAGSVTVPTFTGAVRLAGGSGRVDRVRLRKSSLGLTNTSFRVHLFNAVPTVVNGDNGVFSSSGNANYLGAVDIQIDQAFTDGSSGFGLSKVGGGINFKPPSGTAIYALLEARGAYVPTSAETFTIELEIFQD